METAKVIQPKPENCNGEENQAKEKLNLILFSMGKLVSLLGTYIYTFAISLYVLKVTGSGTSFAFSILVGTIPRVILSPIAGSISDRVNKKKMIVRLDFLSGFVLLLLLAMTMIYGVRLPFIYAASFILSVISTFFNNCFNAAIPSLVTDKSLMKINAYSRSIESVSQILGPVLGGIVFGLISLELFFLMNGISYILSAVSEMFIDFNFNKARVRKLEDKAKISLNTVWMDIKEVITYIRGNKILCVVMPFSISCNFFLAASFSVVLPYVINNVLGMSSVQYGMIEGAFPIGMLLAAIIIGKLPEQTKKRKSLFIGIMGMGVASIVMGLPVLGMNINFDVQLSFLLYMALLFVMAIFIAMLDMPMMVVMQREIPNDMLGRVMGVLGTISAGLAPLGIILAGVFMDMIPAYIVFFITGIYFLIAAIVLYKNKAMQEY
jgi:MFS transporter, DHA3 family, macrolide efflux protein